MMSALPTTRESVQKRKMLVYVALSYIIGLGICIPIFFQNKTQISNDCHSLFNVKNVSDVDCYDPYGPWLEVIYKKKYIAEILAKPSVTNSL